MTFSFRFSHLNTDDSTSLDHGGEGEEDAMLRVATVKTTNCICGPYNRQKQNIRKKNQDKRDIEREMTKKPKTMNKQTKSNRHLLIKQYLFWRRIHTEISGTVLIRITKILQCHSRNKLSRSEPSLCKHPHTDDVCHLFLWTLIL